MTRSEISKAINTAATYLESGKYQDADRLCQQVIQQEPNNGQALYLMGRIATADKRYNQAVRFIEQALQFIPPQPHAFLELGYILNLAKRPTEAIPYLRKATEALKSYEAFRALGYALAAVEDNAGAEQFLLKALMLKPDCSPATYRLLNKLNKVLSAQGKADEIVRVCEQLIGRNQKNPHTYAVLIEHHLKQGEPAAALSACERCLDVEPAYNRALAYKCIALSELGDEDGLHYLFDPEKHIQRIPGKCPPSYDSIETFNAALADFILSEAHLKKGSPEYSTVNGWHSEYGKLFERNRLLGDDMNTMTRKAHDVYIKHMPDDPEHPAVLSRPSETQLISWAVVMDHLGHEKSHIHPKMWIGGVYYVQLPGDFDSQPEKDAGHIVFGQGPSELHPLRKPQSVTMKPAEGDFVIFPGYFWHLTIPLQSHEKRICVAHDLQFTKWWGK